MFNKYQRRTFLCPDIHKSTCETVQRAVFENDYYVVSLEQDLIDIYENWTLTVFAKEHSEKKKDWGRNGTKSNWKGLIKLVGQAVEFARQHNQLEIDFIPATPDLESIYRRICFRMNGCEYRDGLHCTNIIFSIPLNKETNEVH